MQTSNIVKVAFAAVCLVVAGVVLFKYWGDPPPKGPKEFTHWVCLNDQCKHEFTLAWTDYQSQKKNGLKCPKCGTVDPERGIQCPSCSKILRMEGHGTPPKVCPSCKKPVPARPKDPPPDE